MAKSKEAVVNTDWREEAACIDTNPDLFFPIGKTGRAAEQANDAKKICGQCIAQIACLEYALNAREQYGIWGGTTEEERQVILKSRDRSQSA